MPFWDSRGGGRLCTGPRPCLPSQQPLLGQYHFPQIPCLPPTWPLRCGPTWDGTEFPDAVSLQRRTGGVGKDGRVGLALQGGGGAGFMTRDDLTLGKTRGRGSWKFQEMRSVGIPSCPNSLQGSVVPAPLLRGRFLLPLCPPLCHRGQRGNGKPGSGHPEVRKRQQSSSGSCSAASGAPTAQASLRTPWGTSPTAEWLGLVSLVPLHRHVPRCPGLLSFMDL